MSEDTIRENEKKAQSAANENAADNETHEEQIPDLMLAKQELEEMELKLREYEEVAKRARAEAENIRKRMEKEKRDLIRYANKNLLAHFLEFIDDFERALTTKPDEAGEQFYKGMELIYKRLSTFLESYGVKELDADGAEFDPNIHEAIGMEEDGKYDTERVIEVYQKGYKMYDGLLRTAKVKIGKPPFQPEQAVAAEANSKENSEEPAAESGNE